MPIFLCCFQPPAIVGLALASAPFGMPTTPFWMYVSGTVILIAGFVKIPRELPQEQGIDKIMPFGRLFFAMPLAVFGSEHFTIATDIASMVPSWIPWHMFWAYAIGLGFLLAALSMVLLIQARLAAALVGMTMFIFVCVMDIPGLASSLHDRFAWALTLRELSFGSGGFALAISLGNARRTTPARQFPWISFPRCFIGLAALFYGVEHLLHPEHVPGVPLEKLSPEWIPGRIGLSYFVGVILILAGACLLANKKTRLAATFLGLTILLTMVWIYLPILMAAPKDVVALNYFFDTLLYCGTILLLANALPKESAAA